MLAVGDQYKPVPSPEIVSFVVWGHEETERERENMHFLRIELRSGGSTSIQMML